MIQDEKYVNIKKEIKEALPSERYQHTLGVAFTAACLAMKYGEDMEKAYLAGLLHDCAKSIPAGERVVKCRKWGLTVTEVEERAPELLHSKMGAYLAEKKYGITDREILDAITFHTTGRPAMTLLDKIIYAADYIEPNRYKQPNLPELRKLAFENLDRAVMEMIRQSVEYVKGRYPDNLDEMSVRAYEYYVKEMKVD